MQKNNTTQNVTKDLATHKKRGRPRKVLENVSEIKEITDSNKSETTQNINLDSMPKSKSTKDIQPKEQKPTNSRNQAKSKATEAKIKIDNKQRTTKLVVITGATSGMGLRILEELVTRSDMEIIAVGRRPQLCRDIVLKIKSMYPDAKLHFLVSDLSLINQTNKLIQDIIAKVAELGYTSIDTLYLNAGLVAQKVELTYEGHEKQWATNYLSPILMLEKLYPLLQKSSDARVILVTNSRSNKLHINWKALREPKSFNANTLYDQSKLALLIYALEFHYRHLDNLALRMLVVNPGKVKTQLTTKETSGWKKFKNAIANWSACSIEEGIRTTHYLITADTLPHNVVCYRSMRAIMPSTYCMNTDIRYKLFNATRRMLDLPALGRINQPLEDDIPLTILPEWR